MNNIDIPSTKEIDNYTAFLVFCKNLKFPVQRESDHLLATVQLTCYRKDWLDRYSATLLLIRAGAGLGNIRIWYGENELMDEHVYKVLERTDRIYSLGRTGLELIIDCEPETLEDIHRIDIEENRLAGSYSIKARLQRNRSFSFEIL